MEHGMCVLPTGFRFAAVTHEVCSPHNDRQLLLEGTRLSIMEGTFLEQSTLQLQGKQRSSPLAATCRAAP